MDSKHFIIHYELHYLAPTHPSYSSSAPKFHARHFFQFPKYTFAFAMPGESFPS